MRSLFSGLRGKLILTYTLVTVLALMALETILILGLLGIYNHYTTDLRSYLEDVISTLVPQSRPYLQPGERDIDGLQTWLDEVHNSGIASLPPQGFLDSPPAFIAGSDPIFVISPDRTVLAQSPRGANDLVGRQYTLSGERDMQSIFDNALQGSLDPMALSMQTPEGNYQMAIPVTESGLGTPVMGMILVTVEPVPPVGEEPWLVFVAGILGTGLLLLVAVAPFGALFGLVMSRGLTRRLAALSRAADAWSEGDFQALPVDRSKDEIGVLSRRLQSMAERIQNLLQTQQELAVLEERNRLARDLHDTVKQQSFATLMQVRAARNLLESDPSAAKDHLTTAEDLIKSSQQELGILIAELRPAALEGQGLSGALRTYLASWSEHTRIPAHLKVANDRRLPLAVEQTLYRVAQEALANAARHSRASSLIIQLEFNGSSVHLIVADNGVGFLPQDVNSGFGLETMRERVREIGGQLEVASLPDQGTRISARVPLQ